MYGQQNVKICDTKQANQVHQSKNTKIKLYKSNADIWYNKTCRIKQLIPTYVNIRVIGNNSRCQRTKESSLNLCTGRPPTGVMMLYTTILTS